MSSLMKKAVLDFLLPASIFAFDIEEERERWSTDWHMQIALSTLKKEELLDLMFRDCA